MEVPDQKTFVNAEGEWEGLPPDAAPAPEPVPEPTPTPIDPEEKRCASVEEAAKAAEAAGVKNAVMMGLDMATDEKLLEDMLGLQSGSAPSGKLSAKQRTAKQKAKLQRGLLREATGTAQEMQKINAAARAQMRPPTLTAPRAYSAPPACTRRNFIATTVLVTARTLWSVQKLNR